MMVAYLAGGTVLLALVAVAAILLWARSRVRAQQARDVGATGRQRYLTLAAQAASDPSGRQLMRLLDEMETAPADCPVTASWVRHQPADKPLGMLVRISWDGNEWRRVMPWGEFRDQVRAHVDAEPGAGPRVRRLLEDLEATP
jgi:hypothetical protein